jgi:hypothetical protein
LILHRRVATAYSYLIDLQVLNGHAVATKKTTVYPTLALTPSAHRYILPARAGFDY